MPRSNSYDGQILREQTSERYHVCDTACNKVVELSCKSTVADRFVTVMPCSNPRDDKHGTRRTCAAKPTKTVLYWYEHGALVA